MAGSGVAPRSGGRAGVHREQLTEFCLYIAQKGKRAVGVECWHLTWRCRSLKLGSFETLSTLERLEGFFCIYRAYISLVHKFHRVLVIRQFKEMQPIIIKMYSTYYILALLIDEMTCK